MAKFNISILPAGAWGTALAIPLSDNGHNVNLYFRQEKDAQSFNKVRQNLKRLPKVKFNGIVSGTHNLGEAVSQADVLVLACDSVHIRNFFTKTKSFLNRNTKILCVSKGIEEGTNLCMSDVIAEVEPNVRSRLAVLSGPNFAIEVAQRLPTLTVIASKNNALAKLLQNIFTTKNFKVYTQDDILGVELGGALKNVIAIGVGIGDGLKMGENGRAALITRGITEMIRLGTSMGANKLTFTGLSGMGDLILSCTSGKSRNHQAGLMIGNGISPKDLLNSKQTLEGLHTVKAAIALAKRKKVKIPIMETVYKIVYQNLKPKEAFKQLMKIELSSENGN